ncbi:hypothetical protein MMC14_004443, partial [Varicellaria rhodocarpa]|nr:hypothetical protein [Varicellaria rhodocarpa]
MSRTLDEESLSHDLLNSYKDEHSGVTCDPEDGDLALLRFRVCQKSPAIGRHGADTKEKAVGPVSATDHQT